MICALVPSLVFLGRYGVDGTGVAPAGSDTSQHVWRSQVVADLGVDALPAYAGTAQALNTNADRPGLPLVFSTLSAVSGSDVLGLAYVLPAVLAAAIALAAAALAGTIAGVPWWGVVVAGVATGASVPVAFAANGYLDQLLVEPLVLAAAAARSAPPAAAAGSSGSSRCSRPGSSTGSSGRSRPCCSRSWRSPASRVAPRTRRRPTPHRDGHGRVGTVAAGGSALGIASLLLGTPGFPRTPSGLSRHRSAGTSRTSWIGTGSSSRSRSRPWPVRSSHSIGGALRRRAAWFLIPWALVPAAAARVRARSHPAAGPNALLRAGDPLARGLGLVLLLGWLRERLGGVVAAAAAILVAAALVVSATFAWDAWRSRDPWSEDATFSESGAGHLAAADRPAIVVVDGRPGADRGAERSFGTVPVMRRLRAALPASDALRTFVYLGDPERLLAGPTLRPDVPGFDEVSTRPGTPCDRCSTRTPRSSCSAPSSGVRGGRASAPRLAERRWVAIVVGPDPPATLAAPAPADRPDPATLFGRWALSSPCSRRWAPAGSFAWAADPGGCGSRSPPRSASRSWFRRASS